ncbi:MAG TPA: 2'-5' RNA ligase family protein, partial [Gaiellaceae bacterium]|nr:2'-5' RNA ligase family protein [Gaiellaceae bacterium]
MQPADRTTVVAVATLRVTRHGLIVPFDDLAAAVDEWRERTCAAKPSHGVPPHVTLLLPCPGDAEGIAHALEPFPAFDVAFRDVDTFPGALWLAPDPGDVFRAITAALVEAFPDFQPYEGQ